MAFDPNQLYELRYNTFSQDGDVTSRVLQEEGIRVIVRIRSSSPLDRFCVVQVVDGARSDRYAPFAAEVTRVSGALRLQAAGKTILSSLGTMGDGLGDEAGFLQPITIAQPVLAPVVAAPSSLRNSLDALAASGNSLAIAAQTAGGGVNARRAAAEATALSYFDKKRAISEENKRAIREEEELLNSLSQGGGAGSSYAGTGSSASSGGFAIGSSAGSAAGSAAGGEGGGGSLNARYPQFSDQTPEQRARVREYTERTREEAELLASQLEFTPEGRKAYVLEKLNVAYKRALDGLPYESPQWTSMDFRFKNF
jgi:hypothetical protein